MQGTKYACLCLDTRVEHPLPEQVAELGEGYSIAPIAQLNVDSWKAVLGSDAVRKIRDSDVGVWVQCASSRPNVLDKENEQLVDRLFCFWKALQLHSPPVLEAHILSGERSTGASRQLVRPATISVKQDGEPFTLARLQEVAATAGHIERALGRFERNLERGFSAFLHAMTAEEVDISTMEFVRALEGIVRPPIKGKGEEFAKRIEHIVTWKGSVNLRERLVRLYRVRNHYIHALPLEDVFPSAPPQDGDKAPQEARELMGMAYAIAAACYRVILADKTLVRFFSNRDDHTSHWERAFASGNPLFQARVHADAWKVHHT